MTAAAKKALSISLTSVLPDDVIQGTRTLTDGSLCSGEILRPAKISAKERTWIYDLNQRNMASLYHNASFSYTEKEKKKELFDTQSRFCILRATKEGQAAIPIGYAMFRFDDEPDRDDIDEHVVYCYEVQLEPQYNGQGLGRLLMTALEDIGKKYKLVKVMLTVFKSNESAVKFYHALGFTSDPIEPTMELDGEVADYHILSKKL